MIFIDQLLKEIRPFIRRPDNHDRRETEWRAHGHGEFGLRQVKAFTFVRMAGTIPGLGRQP